MHIIQVAAEFAPLIKAGGLGEVLVGLSRQLSASNHRVDVILPKYDFIPLELLANLKLEIANFTTWENSREIKNTMWSAEFENIHLHLLEPHHPANYFNRGKIYGFEDDVPRFLYFCKATIEYLKIKQFPIDILHLHDWHAAPAAALAREHLPPTSIALSIHNLEHQGKCGAHDLIRIGLHDQRLKKFQCDQYPDSFNSLKGGIEECDAIIPVSPTYAKEILTAQYGFGLDSTLLKHQHKIRGILNGIDEILWNPDKDHFLEAKFNPSGPLPKVIDAKKKNQDSLAKRFGIKGPKDAPWIGTITRIVHQKGPEFLEAAIEQTIQNGGIFALLGSSPIPKMQSHFEQLKMRYKSHSQVFLHLDFDEELAHQLYAALDFILLPSHFEPCGLTQLIGMHYGAIPIVRSTGGLKDTVFEKTSLTKQNGYVFEGLEIPPFLEKITEAVRVMKTEPQRHAQIMSNGLKSDFGWEKPAKEYLELYRNLIRLV